MKGIFRPYRIGLHKLMLILCMVVIVVLCIFTFSFFITFISKKFEESSRLEYVDTTILPDFLGGLCGILIASLLEFSIISKLNNLKYYEAMVPCLKEEFDKILNQLFIEKNCRKFGGKFSSTMITQISTSIEAYTKFYNLPRYLPFMKKGLMAREIDRLRIYVDNANESLSQIYKKANETDSLAMVIYCVLQEIKKEKEKKNNSIIADLESYWENLKTWKNKPTPKTPSNDMDCKLNELQANLTGILESINHLKKILG